MNRFTWEAYIMIGFPLLVALVAVAIVILVPMLGHP
jgi:hypothetical protein